jgi:hypothetical protein
MIHSGNRLINQNTIFFCVFMFPFLIFQSIQMQEINFFMVLFPIMYLLFSIETSYFIIDDEFFIVKFYSLPFIRIKYKLTQIETIKISGKWYRSFSKAQLQVKMNGKKSVAFRSASMKNKHWRMLLDDLKKHNVNFNEDCYDYFKEIKTYKEIQEEKRLKQNN